MVKTQHSKMHEGKFAKISVREERNTPCEHHHPYTVGPREETKLYAQEVSKPYKNILYKQEQCMKKQVEESVCWRSLTVRPLQYVRNSYMRNNYTSYMEVPPRMYEIDPTKQHVVTIFGLYTVQLA